MELTADAVLLDLDGTLVDSLDAIVRSWVTWAREYGVTEEALRRAVRHGRPAGEIVADLVPAGRVAGALARIVELEVTDTRGVVALPGAAELLSALPPGRWAVVTSGTRALATARLRATGLPFPAVLVTADDVRRGKPDPEPFLLGASRLGVPPERCVVLEDAPTGLTAATAAGMRRIGVAGTHPGTELDADVVLHRLDELKVTADADGLTLRTPD